MNVISFDLPTLTLGLVLLAWSRIWQPRYVFHILCQVVSTFAGQFSLGVSWSLMRLVPMLAMTAPKRLPCPPLRLFLPFFLYAILATLLFSQQWSIPPGVSKFYGEYRWIIQTTTALSLGVAAAALADTLSHPRAPLLLFDALTATSIVHGLGSAYQLIAERLGLPLIGISRAFLNEADVAFFGTESSRIVRPGGFAGEPKTVAVIFATYLLARIFGPPNRVLTRRRKIIEAFALAISSFGLLITWSTSVFVGGGVAAIVLLMRYPLSAPKTIARIGLVVAVAVAGWGASQTNSDDSLADIFRMRTSDRLQDRQSALDEPVAAAIEAMESNVGIAAFGTGLGGSSFIAMKYMGNFEYARAPNVMVVLIACELGIFGLLLFLIPATVLFLRPLPPTSHSTYSAARFYCATGFGSLIVQLAGSGIAMGIPLSVGCLCAASMLSRHGWSRAVES